MNSPIEQYIGYLQNALNNGRYHYLILHSAEYICTMMDALGLKKEQVPNVCWEADPRATLLYDKENGHSILLTAPGAADVLILRTIAYLREGQLDAAQILVSLILEQLPTNVKALQLRQLFSHFHKDKFVSLKEISSTIHTAFNLDVWELKDISFHGSQGLIELKNGRFPIECSPQDLHFSALQDAITTDTLAPRSIDTVIPLNGVCADNFWHWCIEQLPRAAVAQSLNLQGMFLIPKSKAAFISPTLLALGISADRIVQQEAMETIHAKTAFLIEHPDRSDISHDLYRTIREKVRKHCGIANIPPTKRLYVTRKHSRAVVNEEELLKLLIKYNFETVCFDGMSFADQLRITNEGEVFLGPHGASFTHCMFMQERSVVIELFSPNYVNPCMTAVNRMLHHRYHMVVAKNPSRHYAYSDDIVAPLDEIEIVLEQL